MSMPGERRDAVAYLVQLCRWRRYAIWNNAGATRVNRMRRRCLKLRKKTMHEPLAIINAIAMIAIDPHNRAVGRFGDEIITAQIVAVPPAGFDALGTILQYPRGVFQAMLQRLGFV